MADYILQDFERLNFQIRWYDFDFSCKDLSLKIDVWKCFQQ